MSAGSGGAILVGMTWHAYLDESEPATGGTYVLACSLVVTDHLEGLRSRLSALRLPGEQKVHWYERSRGQRRLLVETIAAMPAIHHIVVRDDCGDESSERRRRKCLERMLWNLEHVYGVESVVVEARQARQNAKDRHLLDSMRARRDVSSRLRIAHVPGWEEPLLWLPDIIAGAFGDDRRKMPGIFSMLGPIVELESISGLK